MKINKNIDFSIFIIVLFLIYIVMQGLLNTFLYSEIFVLSIFWLVVSVVLSIVGLLVYKKIFKQKIRTGFGIKNIDGVCIGLIIIILTFTINHLNISNITGIFSGKEFYTQLIGTGLAAGIFEEICFRGLLLDFISKKINKYLAILIVSVSFGLIHLLNFIYGEKIEFVFIIAAICAGIFMGLLYCEYGITESILYHVIWNILFANTNIENNYSTIILLVVFSIIIIVIQFLKKRLTKVST
jgi:uncharacterized protein